MRSSAFFSCYYEATCIDRAFHLFASVEGAEQCAAALRRLGILNYARSRKLHMRGSCAPQPAGPRFRYAREELASRQLLMCSVRELCCRALMQLCQLRSCTQEATPPAPS